MKLLGLDIGTGGSRAVLIDEEGKVVATATAPHRDFAAPRQGWAEQDPDDWWRACRQAIAGVLKIVHPDEIGAIGLSGQMHGSVFLDGAGEVIRPALLWCDQRTEKQCSEISGRFGKEKLIGLVCNPAVTGFTLPKLLWMRECEPADWDRVRAVLLPKDYIRFRLSGDKASDAADMSGTLFFDVRNRKYSDEVLSAFAIDRALLPEVYESIEITGTVSESGAKATGLKPGTPIVAGAGDNAAGAIGMGIVESGKVSATIGTSGVVFAVSDAPRPDLRGRIHTLCHAIPDRWHNTGVTLAAGFSLKWFRDNFGDGRSYDELVREAETAPTGSGGVVWLPYLMGERAPHLDPKARAAFVGITAAHSRAHLTRAVLEGVAFSLRDCLEIFRESGVEVASVRLGGGGAGSRLWRRIQADVYGKPVEIIEAGEGAAFGAAVLAGVGAAVWNSVDEACRQTIKVVETIDPEPGSSEKLDRNYEAYKMLYSALCPAIEVINSGQELENK